MIDELQTPLILNALLQSIRFRSRASYSAVFAATTISPLIDSMNVKIRDVSNKLGEVVPEEVVDASKVAVSIVVGEVRVVEKAVELTLMMIQEELAKLNIGMLVTKEDHDRIQEFQERLQAARDGDGKKAGG